MAILSKSAGYALSALSCLETRDCQTGFVRDVAECSKVPPAYLAKIFKKLVDAGILTSKRGWAGGTHLARPATEITLLEIAHAVDGDEWQTKCLLGMAECSDSRACPTHQFWKQERQRIAEKLAKITLADFEAFESSRKQKLQTTV